MKFASERFSCRALRSTKAFTLGFILMSNVVVFCSRTGLFIHCPIRNVMRLYFLNTTCYNFEVPGVIKRCRTPRHTKGQLEPIRLFALLAGVISGGQDFASAIIFFLSRTPEPRKLFPRRLFRCDADHKYSVWRFGGAPVSLRLWRRKRPTNWLTFSVDDLR
jgi:hypothetical protein